MTTAGTIPLPAAKDVRDMLTGLVGKPVGVTPGAPVTPAPDRPVAVAVYVDPGMAVNALCLLDLGAAAYTGGALALLPPGGCQDAAETRGAHAHQPAGPCWGRGPPFVRVGRRPRTDRGCGRTVRRRR